MGSKFPYKFFAVNFLLAFFLFGCGGGGKGQANSSVSVSTTSSSSSSNGSSLNTAPTLSGSFTLEAKAKITSILVINAADVENDQLQVSIPNKPEWLSVTLNNNQVTITALPDFLILKITVSS